MRRLDQLNGPVEVGKYYVVPTVEGEWMGHRRAWPVLGPKHDDTQCLNFSAKHYHFDPRFMPQLPRRKDVALYWRYVMSSPLMSSGKLNPDGLPPVVYRRRLCRRLANPMQPDLLAITAEHPHWKCHFDQWAGKQARHDGRGWVCPHRNVPLADHVAVDGVITCPLHLLRLDATTGVVLPGPHSSNERGAD